MKRLWKSGIALVAGSLLSASALALPNCWTNHTVHGTYVVGVHLPTITVPQITSLLREANGQYITPKYPILYDDVMYLTIDARKNRDGSLPSRSNVESEVNRLLKGMPISSVDCDDILYPTMR